MTTQFTTRNIFDTLAQWLSVYRHQAVLVALLAVALYANTVSNGYALDDEVVIEKNEFVLEGVQGIPDILTHDAFYSYYSLIHTTDFLKGGRYRPLSIITFAVEQQILGAIPPEQADSVIGAGLDYKMKSPYERKFLRDMHVRHAVNVLLFALSAVALLYLLYFYVFRHRPFAALVAVLLFVVHPIHTEVVANVKSRDEILSLLFICTTFISALRYVDDRKNQKWLAMGMASLFLALLSKEYAITMVGLLPLCFYLFRNMTVKQMVMATLPYLGVAAVYVFIRWQVTGLGGEQAVKDIQINPYAYATASQKLATELATPLNYLRLLLFPYKLSSDYAYNQIPYKSFGDAIVWVSVALHAALVGLFFYFLRKRHVLALAIAIYLVNLLLVSNLIFDVGATMCERFIYHSSVGFVLAIALLADGAVRGKARVAHMGMAFAVAAVCIAGSIRTIARNRDWKNNETLYMSDIRATPNSFLINMNVASTLVNRSDYEKDSVKMKDDLVTAIPYFNKVLAMQQTYLLAYMNKCIAFYKLNVPDSALSSLDRVKALYPSYPGLVQMYFRVASEFYGSRQFTQASAAMGDVLQLQPGNPQALHARIYIDSVARSFAVDTVGHR